MNTITLVGPLASLDGRASIANEGIDFCFANQLNVGADGWAMIAPLGDYPGMALIDAGNGRMRKAKAIQRIDAEAVAQMVNEFNAGRRGRRRYGRPIYLGHPDVPDYEQKYPDKTVKGVFSELQARADGLYGMPVFTNEGSDLVENKKVRALSGRWSAEPAGEDNGIPVFRPSVFISAGLTNSPNLPVQLLNEAESDDAAASNETDNQPPAAGLAEQDRMLAEAKAALKGGNWQAAVRAVEGKLKGAWASNLFLHVVERLEGEFNSSPTTAHTQARMMFRQLAVDAKDDPFPSEQLQAMKTHQEKSAELVNEASRAAAFNAEVDQIIREKRLGPSSYPYAARLALQRRPDLADAMQSPKIITNL